MEETPTTPEAWLAEIPSEVSVIGDTRNDLRAIGVDADLAEYLHAVYGTINRVLTQILNIALMVRNAMVTHLDGHDERVRAIVREEMVTTEREG